MPKSKGHTKQQPKVKDMQYNGQKQRTYNTMAKSKGQTTQWPKEKGQNITRKTKDRATRTPLKAG